MPRCTVSRLSYPVFILFVLASTPLLAACPETGRANCDGSLFTVTNSNSVLQRLAISSNDYILPVAEPMAAPVDTKIPASVIGVLKQNCSPCHVELRQNPALLLNENRWLAQELNRFVMEQRIFDSSSRGMPPGNPLGSEERELLQRWFDGIRATP